MEKKEVVEMILKMDSRLNQIEVKGESVEHLLTARIMLKEVMKFFDELEEKEQEE
jgi:hypothetical protein